MGKLHQIVVWQFDEAPMPLQRLSQNEGGEEWLAVLPPSYKNPKNKEGYDIPEWMKTQPFAKSHIEIHDYPCLDNYTVVIGCWE